MAHPTSWRRAGRVFFTVTLLLVARGVEGQGIEEVTVAPETPTVTSSSTTECFDLAAEHNITHVCLNVDEGTAVTVTVDGEPVTQLYSSSGGPCESETIWFPLTGNQNTAHVCVSTIGSGVVVGAKAQWE
jgi:hypothetical protein